MISNNSAAGRGTGSVYDGLLEHHDVAGDDSQWAFGTDFEDPLAGVDTAVPAGITAADLATYCLMLGDDALVLSHRLSQWCSNAPDLEEDIALANIALDLLGQARLLLARAAAADPAVVPPLPVGSPVPAEDALAFFRDAAGFRNLTLCEVDNGDFAHTMVRVLMLATTRLALCSRLTSSRDPVLAAIAAKAVKELTYHRDYSARWVLTLARGTDESRERTLESLNQLVPLGEEMVAGCDLERALAIQGIGVDPQEVAEEYRAVIAQVVSAGGLAPVGKAVPDDGLNGRGGVHTTALVEMLAEMQEVARAHPMGRW